jgi:cardiolipin synthase
MPETPSMAREKILNLPNLISFYRLASFPFILWMAYAGKEGMFATFFCVNLVSDILDGLIARIFKLSTRFGARLDSLADITLYLSAAYGIYRFKWADLGPHRALLYAALAFYLLPLLVSFIRFGKFPSLHLYACKIGAYLQGFFFFALFVWGFQSWLFHVALFWGMAAWLEETLVLLSLKEMQSDARGLYWVLKSKSFRISSPQGRP